METAMLDQVLEIVRHPWFDPKTFPTYKVLRSMRKHLPRRPMFLKTFRGTYEDASGVRQSRTEIMPFFSHFHLLRILLVLDNNIDRLDPGPTTVCMCVRVVCVIPMLDTQWDEVQPVCMY
jgi:hypothetical protein